MTTLHPVAEQVLGCLREGPGGGVAVDDAQLVRVRGRLEALFGTPELQTAVHHVLLVAQQVSSADVRRAIVDVARAALPSLHGARSERRVSDADRLRDRASRFQRFAEGAKPRRNTTAPGATMKLAALQVSREGAKYVTLCPRRARSEEEMIGLVG